MAIRKITRIQGTAKEETERRPAEKVGSISPPSTVPKPTLRPLPTLPGAVGQSGQIEPLPGEASSAPAAESAVTAVGARRVSSSAAPQEHASSSAEAAQSRDLAFHMPGEDADAKLRYESSLAELEALRESAPRYDSRYDAEIRELYEKLTSRGPFRYDSATDPLYQQYRQDYASQGRMAMRDTMGRASGLTGGYGSSYAQSVSQQQYDAYLRRLADVLPETYGMALDAWEAEGREMQRRYDAASALEKSDYERYLDELGQYNRRLDRARSDADTAYERMTAGEERAYRRAADDYKRRLGEEERAQSAAASKGSTTRIIIKSKDGKSSSKKTGSGGKSSGNLKKRSAT